LINYSYTLTSGATPIKSESNITSGGSHEIPELLGPATNYKLTITDNCRANAAAIEYPNLEVIRPGAIEITEFNNFSLACFDAVMSTPLTVISPTPTYTLDIRKNGIAHSGYPNTSQASGSTMVNNLTVDNTYQYVITATENCAVIGVPDISDTFSFTVASPATSQLNASLQKVPKLNTYDLSCAESTDGEIKINVIGGVRGSGAQKYNIELLDAANNLVGGTIGAGTSSDLSNPAIAVQYSITGLKAGINYKVKVTDFSTPSPGCEKTVMVGLLTAPQALVITDPVETPEAGNDFVNEVVYSGGVYLKCKGDDNIDFTAKISGGTKPYSVRLYAGTSSSSFSSTAMATQTAASDGTTVFTNLGASWYKIEVSDANLCAFTEQTFQILEATDPIAVADGDIRAAVDYPHGFNTRCHDTADGRVQVDITGGLGPYSYFLDGGSIHRQTLNKPSTSHEYTPGVPAVDGSDNLIEYTLTLHDVLGCPWQPAQPEDAQLTLKAPDAVRFTTSVASPTQNGYEILCKGDAATIHLTSSGGHYDHTFVVDGVVEEISLSDSTFADFEMLADAGYRVTVRDAFNCQAPLQTLILDEPATAVLITAGTITPPVCIGGNTGAINVSGWGGIPGIAGAEYSFTIKPEGASTFDAEVQKGTSATFYRPANTYTSQNYVVRVTDSHGCSDEVTVTMPVNPSPLTLTVDNSVNPSCRGASNGSIQVTATNFTGSSLLFHITGGHLGSTVNTFTSATAQYTYTTLEGTDLFSSTYKVWVEDDNHCQLMAYQYVEGHPDLSLESPSAVAFTEATGSPLRPTCYNGMDGSIDVTISGGTGPYVYSLDNLTYQNVGGSNQVVVPSLAMGDYTIYIRDAQYDPTQVACQSAKQYTVGAGRVITLSAQISRVSCKEGSDGAIDLTANVVNHNFGQSYDPLQLTLSWIGENTGASLGNSEDLTGLPQGSYRVRATYQSCSNERIFTVTEPVTAFGISDIEVYGADCGTANNGMAAISVAGGWPGTPTYYRVDGGSWRSFSSSPFLIQNLSPRAQSYQIEIGQGSLPNPICIAQESFVITRDELEITASAIHSPVCPGESTGSVILESAENNIEYARVITSQPLVFQSFGVFESLSAGTYKFVGRKTGNIGCTSEELEIIVTDPVDCGQGPLTVTAGGVVAATCSSATDGKLQVVARGGVPPYRYYWNGSSTPTSSQAIDLSAGSHSVVVRDAVDASASLMLSVPALPALWVQSFTSLTSCSASCDGEASLLVQGGSGSYSVEWIGHTQTTLNRNDLCVGDHEFIIRDTGNSLCTVNGTVTIDHQPSLSLTTLKQSPTCPEGDDGSVQLQISGGSQRYAVSWNGGGSALTRTNLRAGNYEVTILDQTLGCSLTQTISLEDSTPIQVTSALATAPKCYGGADGRIELSLANVTTPLIQWSTGQLGTQIGSLQSGSYDYTITGANGCKVNGSVVVPIREALLVSEQIQDPLCAGSCNGQIALTLQGGTAPYQVNWSNNARGLTVRNLCAGSYTYAVTDQYSCKVVKTVNITSPSPITLTSTATNPSCYGSKDGSVVIHTSGGTGIYTYQWTSSSVTTSTRSGLGRGGYTVTVQDDHGCATSKTITLTEPSVFQLSNEVVEAPTCQGASNGKITVFPAGGTAPYSYQWEDQNSQSARTNLSAGTYRLTVRDSKSCTVSKSYVLLSPLSLELVNVQLTDPHCFGQSNGSVSVEAQGGVSPYSYSWEGGAPSGSAFNNLKAGEYDLVVADAKGCTRAASYSLVNPALPVITGIASETVICTGGEATLTPEGSWSKYQWSGPKGFTSTQAQITTGLPGSYTLTAYDLGQCPASLGFKVVVSPNALTADFLRISKAVAYEPIVFVDISIPLPEQTEWLVPDDHDVLVNRQTAEMIEITFMRSGDFQIGIKATMGNCASTLYKVVTIEEKAEGEEDEENSGGRTGEKEQVILTLFPNPMSESITVEVSAPTRDAIDLKMISTIDSKVVASRVLEGQLDYRVSWYLPGLTAGIYHLIYEYNNTIYSKRIIVIR
jgi:hypothetical protein